MILCVRVSPAERKMQNEHKALASTSTSWQERINVLEMDNSVRFLRSKLMMVEIYRGLSPAAIWHIKKERPWAGSKESDKCANLQRLAQDLAQMKAETKASKEAHMAIGQERSAHAEREAEYKARLAAAEAQVGAGESTSGCTARCQAAIAE